MTYAVEVNREFSNAQDLNDFASDILGWLFDHDVFGHDVFDHMSLPVSSPYQYNIQFRFEKANHAILFKLAWGGA